MTYETKIVGDVVEVTSPRTHATYRYQIPPGLDPAVFALRCADRARVDECLAAI